MVRCNKRKILFGQANELYITDYFEFNIPMQICVNYIINDIAVVDVLSDSNNYKKEIDENINGVYRMRLFTEKSKIIKFTSKIVLR